MRLSLDLSLPSIAARSSGGGVVPPTYPAQLHLVLAGMSYNSGRASNNQVYTASGAGAQLFGNDYVLKTLVDPVDSNVGQVDTVSSDSASGSSFPLAISRLLARDGAKAVIVTPCPKGGSAVTAWLPGANHEDRTTLYGSMIYRARQVAALPFAALPFVDFMIGAAEAAAGMSKATFKGHVQTIADAIFADLGVKMFLGKWPTPTDAPTLAGLSPIWDGIDELWAAGGNIAKGADLSPVLADDGLHITGDVKNAWESDQRLKVYQAYLGQTVGAVPSTNSLPKSNQFNLWTPSAAVTVTPASAANPLTGAMDASLITCDGTNAQKALNSLAFATVSGQRRDHSIYVKAVSGVQWVQLFGSSAAFGSFFANFDIINGVVGSVGGTSVSTCIERLANGWLRIQAAANGVNTNASAQIVINAVPSSGSTRGVSSTTSGTFLIYGAQDEVRENAGDYVDNP